MRKWACLLYLLALPMPAQQRASANRPVSMQKTQNDTTKVNALVHYTIANAATDSARALAQGRKALSLARKLDWEEGISKSYYALGTGYAANFDYPKALLNFHKAQQTAPSKKLQSKILTAMGSVYINKGNYAQSLAAYFGALRIDESLNDRTGIAKSAMNIATVYYSIRNFPKSIAYFNKSLDQKVEDETFSAVLLRNLAVVYNNIDQRQKALEYFERSLAIYERKKDVAAASSLLSDIALVYYDLEDYEKAIDYSQRSLKTAPQKADDKVNISFTYGIIGDCYTQKAKQLPANPKLIDSAALYLGKAIELHTELHSLRGLYDDYTSLTDAYKLQGNYRKALETYQAAILYKDSIFNAENRETIRNLEDKRSIEIRDKELKISNLKLQSKEKQKRYLSGGLVLLGIIGGLLLYQNNSRKKANRRLNAANEQLDQADRVKTRLLGILNHDLRAPVNSFIHFIQLQHENPELLDDQSKTRIRNATLASAKNLLNTMEDILLWTKNHMENFEPQPKDIRVSELFSDVKNYFSDSGANVNFIIEEGVQIVHTDEDYLKTIMRNLTANAIRAVKQSNDPHIVWTAARAGAQTCLSVQDNGVGADNAQFSALFNGNEIAGVQSGLGLHLVRDLSDAIGCRIEVVSTPGKGTRFTLIL